MKDFIQKNLKKKKKKNEKLKWKATEKLEAIVYPGISIEPIDEDIEEFLSKPS